jgi:N-formylglutamate amidohydrolase
MSTKSEGCAAVRRDTAAAGTLPNTYIDANRHELDIDPDLIEGEWPVPLQLVSKSGLGLLKTVSRYGEPLQERKFTVAEVTARLDRYYRPYHRELASTMERMQSAHGFFYQLSCHCMSAVGAPTHADAGGTHDFVSGICAARPFVGLHRIRRRHRAFAGLQLFGLTPYTGGRLNGAMERRTAIAKAS